DRRTTVRNQGHTRGRWRSRVRPCQMDKVRQLALAWKKVRLTKLSPARTPKYRLHLPEVLMNPDRGPRFGLHLHSQHINRDKDRLPPLRYWPFGLMQPPS